MLGYEHVLLLLPGLVLLAAAGLPGGRVTEAVASGQRRWRIAIYAWLALLPLLVVALQAVVSAGGPVLEYPVIIQSVTMLALCWIARPEWERYEAPGGSRPTGASTLKAEVWTRGSE